MTDQKFKEFSEVCLNLAEKLKEDKTVSLIDRMRPLQWLYWETYKRIQNKLTNELTINTK